MGLVGVVTLASALRSIVPFSSALLVTPLSLCDNTSTHRILPNSLKPNLYPLRLTLHPKHKKQSYPP